MAAILTTTTPDVTYHFYRCICEVDEFREDLAIFTSGVKLGGIP